MNRKTVFIGIGEIEDPLPLVEKTTRFWVFAGPCEKCGESGRIITVNEKFVCLQCEKCEDVQSIGLSAAEFSEITYVYWCNQSRFGSDLVELPAEDRKKIEALAAEIRIDEIPRWAVPVIGGRCSQANICINFDCVFNFPKVKIND